MKAELIAEYRLRIKDRTLITLPVTAIERILEERERLLTALQEAANRLMWAGSTLSHAWAQERAPDKDASEEAYAAEEVARAAIAYAESEWGML